MKGNIQAACYTPYGYTSLLTNSLVGFKGEYAETPLEHYPLGAGHRCYSPQLMRFLSADTKSPFDRGGINAYTYCGGDPINYNDPTGMSRTKYFLHRFIPNSQTASPPQHDQFHPSDLLSLRPSKPKAPRNYLTLEDLSQKSDYNFFNDYSDSQLIQKAQRFHELFIKEGSRPQNKPRDVLEHFRAAARYLKNRDALEVQYAMRYPDHAFALAIQGATFWQSSDGNTSAPSTASSGLLYPDSQIKRVRTDSP